MGDLQGSLHFWPRRNLRQSLWIFCFTRAICADSASLPHTHSFKTFVVKYFRRKRVTKGTVKTCVSPLSLSNKTLPTKLMLLSTCISLPSNIQWCSHYLKFGFDNYHFYIILYSNTSYACMPNHYIILFSVFLNFTWWYYTVCGIVVFSFIIGLVRFIHDGGVPLYGIPQFVSTLSRWWTSSLLANFVSRGQDRFVSITWCQKGLVGRKVVRGQHPF